MGFTTPCFIYKNTNELREKLYRLGGRSGSNLLDIEINTLLGADKYSFRCYYNEYGVAESLIRDNYIDCGNNEELFLAIAALRYDIDSNQYFVLDTTVCLASENCKPKGTFILCKKDKWNVDFDINGNPSVFSSRNIPAHKATVEELIEHFK